MAGEHDCRECESGGLVRARQWPVGRFLDAVHSRHSVSLRLHAQRERRLPDSGLYDFHRYEVHDHRRGQYGHLFRQRVSAADAIDPGVFLHCWQRPGAFRLASQRNQFEPGQLRQAPALLLQGLAVGRSHPLLRAVQGRGRRGDARRHLRQPGDADQKRHLHRRTSGPLLRRLCLRQSVDSADSHPAMPGRRRAGAWLHGLEHRDRRVLGLCRGRRCARRVPIRGVVQL